MPLEAGLAASVVLVVGDADTAQAMGSGSVPVLATPRVVALLEQATCQAIDGRLQPGETTVGVRVQIDHVQPTPVSGEVTATATLDRVTGRKLEFSVNASDGRGLVAAGKVTRVVVDRARFLDRCG